MNRGCIFFFYDGQGIVDRYVTYLLDDLVKNLDRIVFVINGRLGDEGREKFSKYSDEIIVRDNQGLDVAAYKAGLEHIGWDKLAQFDELILMNHTMMGPVYPFSETFEKMAGRDVDFWGLTKHLEADGMYGLNKGGKIPEHLQSHFLVFRKKILESGDFYAYWNDMKKVKRYETSIAYHESHCTEYFATKGYKWDTSVDVSDMDDVSAYPLMYCPLEMVKNRRCPVFKRRSFFQSYDDLILFTAGEPTYELYKFLEESGLYDVEMIWENALRSMEHTEFAKAMHLNYTLPTRALNDLQIEKKLSGKKVALFLHIYYVEELIKLKPYIQNIPEFADIYITTQTQEKKSQIEEFLKDLPNRSTVLLVTNRGRDVSAFLIAGKSFLMDYDYVCFAHDKKVTQDKPGTVGMGFAYDCYKNTFDSRNYILNILTLFEENHRLGVLCPPKPLHGDYKLGLRYDWKMNCANTQAVLERLGINKRLDAYKPPIAPHGSCFWFRPKAIDTLINYDWKYEDFPEEPLAIDGTISHAIERSYAYVAQSRGYYTANVMSDDYARIEYTTLTNYAMSYATGNIKQTDFYKKLQRIEYPVKYGLKSIVPKKLFIKIVNFKRMLFGPHELYKGE